MSFIELGANLAEVQEQKPVESGNYDIVVAYVDEGTSKKGSPMITVGHEIVDHPDAAMVYTYLTLPTEDDEPKARNFKLLQIKRYAALMGLDIDEGFNTEDLYGLSANCYIKKEEIEQEDEGAPVAFRNNMVVPKLQD